MSDKKKVQVYLKDKFRQLEGKELKVENVFPAYRHGWSPIIGPDGKPVMKPNGEPKCSPRSFYYFPIDEREVVESGDAQIMERKGEQKKELREQVYDKASGKFVFKRVKTKLDGAWFKMFKKHFDVQFTLKSTAEFKKYDPSTKTEIDVPATFVQVAVAAPKIQKMIEALTDEVEKVKLVPGKDKTGKEAMVMPYDWEDSLVNTIKGKFVRFTCRGTGTDTVYTFKQIPEFTVIEDSFGSDFGEEKKTAQINVEDIPF